MNNIQERWDKEIINFSNVHIANLTEMLGDLESSCFISNEQFNELVGVCEFTVNELCALYAYYEDYYDVIEDTPMAAYIRMYLTNIKDFLSSIKYSSI
ncbi:hypothetical protein [Serratia rhizosphaerae]